MIREYYINTNSLPVDETKSFLKKNSAYLSNKEKMDNLMSCLFTFNSVVYNLVGEEKITIKIKNNDIFINKEHFHNRYKKIPSPPFSMSANIKLMLLLFSIGFFLSQKPERKKEKREIIKKISGFKTKVISEVVYLKPSKSYSNLSDGQKREKIKHMFEVAGHWRKTRGIGKDQEGKYNQINRTWVTDHKRGEGELIVKQRVLK